MVSEDREFAVYQERVVFFYRQDYCEALLFHNAVVFLCGVESSPGVRDRVQVTLFILLAQHPSDTHITGVGFEIKFTQYVWIGKYGRLGHRNAKLIKSLLAVSCSIKFRLLLQEPVEGCC